MQEPESRGTSDRAGNSPFTVSPPDDRREKEGKKMKIRIMGTESECQAAREYYRALERESNVKSVSISKNYPSRGSNTIFRVYVDVEYYDTGESRRRELPSWWKRR